MNLSKDLTTWLAARDSKPTHRQLLVISGERGWAMTQAHNIVSHQGWKNLLRVGADLTYPNIACHQYRQCLGQEYQAVVYDAFSGLRANALIACSGTVGKGGLMLLLCPDLDKWPSYADPEANKRSSYGYQQADPSHYVHWLISHISSDAQVALLTEQALKAPLSYAQVNDAATFQAPYANQAQQQTVEGIMKVATGRRNRPLLLSADRGRGKSASLGIAAAQLIDMGMQVVVTGPRPQSVETLFKHCTALLPSAISSTHKIQTGSGSLQFMPLDRILADLPDTALLMIDEAAAVPVHQLTGTLNNYSRLVFSTTIHGYEGSGRGFQLRFLPLIKQHYPDYKHRQLTLPIRWFASDPLEAFWNKASLMCESVQNALPASLDSDTLSFDRVSKQTLVDDPALFAEIFQLLLVAHYQTQPDDLARMLDAQDQMLFVLRSENQLIAALLVSAEGGNQLTDLADDIALGKRRVNGHLSPQSHLFHTGEKAWANYQYWRIVRIVVQPSLQRQGMGLQLLDKLKQLAEKEEIDFLTTSFGATKDLVDFWLSAGFAPIRLSYKADAASSERSLLMHMPISQQANEVQNELTTEFAKELLFQANRAFQFIDSHLLMRLISASSVEATMSSSTQIQLNAYIDGNKPYISCEVALHQLTLSALCTPETHPELQLLVSLFIQGRTKKEVFSTSDFQTNKQIEQKIRQLARDLI